MAADDTHANDLDPQKRSDTGQMRDNPSSDTDQGGKLGEKGGKSTQQNGHTHRLSTDDTLGDNLDDQSDYMKED